MVTPLPGAAVLKQGETNDKVASLISKKYDAKPLELTEEERAERSFDLNRVYNISEIRESPHPQFDRMPYMKWNETNEMTDMSFIPPKKNKMDSNIVTGITHEKDSSILSMVQSFNFEAKVTIYKGDKCLDDLSNAATAWIRKARELERYDEKRPILYRNLIVQGTAFAEIKQVERYTKKKIIDADTIDYTKLDELKWRDAGLKKIFDGTVTNLADGKKVFMEDIRQQDIRKQPRVYMIEYPPTDIMESIWGQTKRWKNVPKTLTPASLVGEMLTQGSIYSEWLFTELDEGKCEVIQAFCPIENRYQIYINGVPMLPAGFPLTAISPSGMIPLAKGDLDPMNLFAYSKGIPSKTKIDQAVYDNLVKIMLIKFNQSAFVPRGNMSNQVLSQDVMMPGRMTPGLKATDLPPLIENPGVTNADFSFFNLIKEQIDSKSVSSLLEGNPVPGDMTLGQYMDMQKKQMLKLGGIFDAFINWEKQMAHLTLMNLLINGTKPTTQVTIDGKMTNKYADVVTSDTFENGRNGMHILRFNENNMKTPEEIFDEELKYSKANGTEARISYLDPELLRDMVSNPEYYFCYEVVPVDKNNDKLTQAMFIGMITQAQQIFGMQSLNVDYLKKRYAAVMGEDFDQLFLPQSQVMQPAMNPDGTPAMPGQGQGGGAAGGIAMPKGLAQTMFKQ